ncbi:wax ester synthase/diacylglycerol acyltransferase 11-like isoform X2 [Prosopis cineraria]|uniref:wax ester synthase/diacylglycerol acyltransferase 11-like isoform X2 n=1 Tax=Prosopis cineraria TaxID=364024 RepID=UPI00241096A3|nr:wax ester synthase/diacylglycerol acyltransferase 11-like isoform X2 [Prosopis cineraria]
MGSRDGQAVSPGSRMFHAPGFDCYVIAVMGVKKRIHLQLIKQGLSNTLLNHPRFCSNMVKEGRKWRWNPTTVNLEDHVIVPEIDSYLEFADPDRFLEDYVSNVTKTPLDMSKPLWEMHFLNLKTSEAEAVCVMRVHHSLGDGASLMSLLLAASRKASDSLALPTVPVLKKATLDRPPSGWCLWRFLLVLWGIVTLLWNTLVDLAMFALTVLFLRDSDTPLKGAPGMELKTMRFVHRHLSMDDVKLVKTAMKMTINDVLLGVTLAGLTRYLNRAYGFRIKGLKLNVYIRQNDGTGAEETGGKQRPNHNHNLNNIRLRATIMVNVRPSAGIQELADMMGERSKARWGWGNCLGFVVVPFVIASQDDPLQYLRQAKAIIDRKKHSLESICTFYCSKLVLKFLGIKVASAITRRVFLNTTMAFSNVVGPLEEISSFGHPLAYIAPSTYGYPHALTIHFQSYHEKMTLSMAVDPSAIRDPHLLCDDFQLSLGLIRDAVNKNLVPAAV